MGYAVNNYIYMEKENNSIFVGMVLIKIKNHKTNDIFNV